MLFVLLSPISLFISLVFDILIKKFSHMTTDDLLVPQKQGNLD